MFSVFNNMKSYIFISKDNSEKIHNITVEEGYFSNHLFISGDENEFGGETIIYSFYVPYNQVIPMPTMAQELLAVQKAR